MNNSLYFVSLMKEDILILSEVLNVLREYLQNDL